MNPRTPRLKRYFDLLFAVLGLIALSPLLLSIAAWIRLRDGKPVFFRQLRVGQFGRPFWIWKFRTMIPDAERRGLGVTKDGDARITPTGRWLRKTKLDELPQLWNVLRGDMSFVGPRPEVPQYVERYTPQQREILQLPPGITDLATLEFSHEEELLRQAQDVERFYLEYCLPRKIELNRQYAQHANPWQDTILILKTLFFWRKQRPHAPDSSAARALNLQGG